MFGSGAFWHMDPEEAAASIDDRCASPGVGRLLHASALLTACLFSQCGIMPRAVAELFQRVEEKRKAGATVSVCMSFLQIYIERITDLLAPDAGAPGKKATLPVREDPNTGVFVEGLTTVRVDCVADVLRMVRVGASNRATSSTDQNNASSRSHAMLSFTVEQTMEAAVANADDIAPGTPVPTTAETRKSTLRVVDLAGSERVSKSGSEVRVAFASH